MRKIMMLVWVMALILTGLPAGGVQAAGEAQSTSESIGDSAGDSTGNSAGMFFYVSPNGSDSNSGTEAAPFLTLEKARDAIRQLKQSSGLPDGGVTVYLRGGVYSRTGSFQLEEQDSGTADKPITYKAYPGESVRLSGGKNLEKGWFEPVTDQAVLNRIISADARTKVMQVDLGAHGITDYGVMSRHGYYKANDVSQTPPMELYVEGQGMTLARWPNKGTVQMGDIIDPGPTRKDADLQTRGGTFKYTYERPALWTRADDIWLDGIFGYSWEWSYNKVASIDTVNKTITLAYGEMSGLFKNWYPDFHFAQNLLEEMDMPGEYYIDRGQGILYFMPTAAFQKKANPEIAVTMLKTPMVNTVNTSHVTFEDLIMENGRDSAVVIMGGNHVQLVHVEIRNFTEGGVRINTQSRWLYDDFAKGSGVNHAVVGTHIHHVGGTGVILNGGDRLTLEPGNNVVENSHIHDFAYYHKAYNPAVILTGAGNRISNNEIHDAPHPGVLIFGNDHVVEYNNIYDVCKTFSDLGAIYMNLGASPQERGTVIRRNYFHHIGEGKVGVQGVYPDNFTMGLTIEENIFYRMGNSAILNNGGAHIRTSNNLFIDAKVPYEYSDMYLGDGPDQQISKNYMGPWHALFDKYNNFEGMPHLTKYPELADFFTENRYYPDTNTFKNNVIYNPTKARGTTNANGAYDKRNLVQYANNWVTDHDPGFVNLTGGDLNLKADAEVFQQIPGFKDIPFSEMGLTGKAGPYLAPDTIPVEDVELYDDNLTIGIGKSYDLYSAVLPWNATKSALVYTSSDPSVVKVDANGKLKGVNLGSATVTAASADNPLLKDEVQVTVEIGDGIMDDTNFENGRNSWPTDPNRSIVDAGGGNHMYKLLKGATALNENEFSNYELAFKLKTPPVIPELATFYVFDRLNQSGSGGRIGYRKFADGTSSWILYNASWATIKQNTLDAQDLLPDTLYDIKIIVKGQEISVYANGKLKLKATDPTFNPSGKVGFYAGGFDYLLFDDIRFKVPTTDVAGLLLDKSSVNMVIDEQQQLQVQFDPSDAADRSVVWHSADPEIASVDESGKVTALAKGETTVTVTSAANPEASASVRIIVSDILLSTDFDSGANGWPVDPNRSIVTVNGNKMYRIVAGASSLHPKTFTDYDLTFKLKTPAVMPTQGTFYVYDRSASGTSGKIGYRKLADGTSQWVLYNPNWTVLQTTSLSYQDLQPDSEYTIRILVDGASIRAYVNGELRLDGTDSKHNASGTVGFYVGGFSEFWFDDIKFTRIDRIAPVTEATLSSEQPNVGGEWYSNPVTVDLKALDSGTGVSGTEYSTDGGATWQPYKDQLIFSEDGSYSVLYRSIDGAGNKEDDKTISFKLDASAPVSAITGLEEKAYANSGAFNPSWTVSDALSGVDEEKTAARLDGEPVQPGAAIPLYTLAAGTHTFTLSASDLAGNTGEQTVTFTIYADRSSLKELVIQFHDLNWIDNQEIANSLIEKLKNVSLQAFIHHVEAQSGKHIQAEAASYLLRDATAILQEAESESAA